MKKEDIARVCHEANRALQTVQQDSAVSPEWDQAPDWQTSSSIEGVGRAISGFTARQLHDSWCEFKLADGWVYGEVKDADSKTHPCLVDYDELPADQKIKDHLFSAIVNVLKEN